MRVLARVLVGNYNYGLNHELDIRKFKVFVVPESKEIIYSKKKLGESFPYELEDIRIWINRLISGDILYIETLFSDYVEVTDGGFYYKLREKRDEISLMNLKGVYNNVISFYNDNINKLSEDTGRLGQDRLLAFEIYRQLDFILKYSQGYNFMKAIKYSVEERKKLFKILMLEKMEIEDLKNVLTTKKNLIDGFLPIYSEQKFDLETKKFLEGVCSKQLQEISI